jgi:hypothetical protein
MPYTKAKHWRDTQADIGKLFRKHGIGDEQWSISDQQKRMALSFVKHYRERNLYDYETKKLNLVEPARNVVVRLQLPLRPEGPERNQTFRVLYWYLKSKLEAIAFSFMDGTEIFNFEREFFGNVVIEDDHGVATEAFDAFKRGNVTLTAPERIIALSGGKS